MSFSGAGHPNPTASGSGRVMPSSVKAARVLLFIVAGLALLAAIGLFVYAGASARAAGQAFYTLVPGIGSFVAALLVTRGGRGLRGFIIGWEILYILVALGEMGSGNAGAILQLGFPIAILILITRPAAGAYFRRAGQTA